MTEKLPRTVPGQGGIKQVNAKKVENVKKAVKCTT